MTWRPLPAPPGQEDPLPLSVSLDRVARSLGGPPAAVLGAVFMHWEEIVGPALAAHAQPGSVARGTLLVVVDHPAWATEVRWLAPRLLARLTEIAGDEVATTVQVRVARR